MLNRTAPLLVVSILIALSNCLCTESLVINDLYVYSIVGEYIGVYRLELSGLYKTLFTNNRSDYNYGYLKITYYFNFSLNIRFDKYSYSYLYIYYLSKYSIEHYGLPHNVVSIINETLGNLLNKIVVEYSSTVDPSLLININNWNRHEIVFENLGDKYSLTGLSLFNDILCFENTIYREEITERTIRRYIGKIYYEPISYTPLYVFLQSVYIDLLNETNYMRTTIEINQNNIGYGLSKISKSVTYHIFFKNNTSGRIGIVTYNNLFIRISHSNNIVYVNVNTDSPYRLVVITNNYVEVERSSVELRVYSLKINNIYLSSVLLVDNNTYVSFSQNVSRIQSISGNSSFVHDLTIIERQYSSLNIVLFTLFINAILIYIIYRLSRIFTSVVSRVLE